MRPKRALLLAVALRVGKLCEVNFVSQNDEVIFQKELCMTRPRINDSEWMSKIMRLVGLHLFIILSDVLLYWI